MMENNAVYKPLSPEEVSRKIEKFVAIVEEFLGISRNEEKRKAILEDVLERNKKSWTIDPDFYIRGRIVQEFQILKLKFLKQISFYRKFGFNFHDYAEYLIATRDFEGSDQFQSEEIRLGPHSELSLNKYLGEKGPHSFIYAVLQAIKGGYSTESTLLQHFKYFFGPEWLMVSASIRANNIREALKFLKAKELIVEENGIYSASPLGKRCATYGKLELKHEIYWVAKILSEKLVIITSLIFLILLSALKLYFGWSTNSSGLFSDGIENSTDIIKILIITLSIKFTKDRLGSIGIMIMMLFAGATLCYRSVSDLLVTPLISTGSINGIGFSIAFLSLLLNAILMQYKFFVGKRAGNLSILSDAKDSVHNMQIAGGVLIGLFFAIFGLYVVDILVGLGIAILILWDGGFTLKELIMKGEEIDVDAIHIGTDDKYIDRITHWTLTVVENEELSRNELNLKFQEGLKVGYNYFDEWAVIGYHKLQEKGIFDKIDRLIRTDLLKEENGKLSLTQQGYIKYYELQSRDLKNLAKSINEKRRRRLKILNYIIAITIIVGIIILLIFIYI